MWTSWRTRSPFEQRKAPAAGRLIQKGRHAPNLSRSGERVSAAVRAAVLAASASVLVAAAAVPAPQASVGAQSQGPVAQSLGQRFGFTPDQLAAVDAGTGVAVVLPSSVDHEIAVAGAVFVRATGDRLVSVLQDVERLESGKGFIRTKRLSNPPRLADFAGLQLPPADVEALRGCAPGTLRCQTRPGRVRPAREGRLVGARRGSTGQRPLPADLARLRRRLPEGRKQGAGRLPGLGSAAVHRARIRGDDRPGRPLAGRAAAARQIPSAATRRRHGRP